MRVVEVDHNQVAAAQMLAVGLAHYLCQEQLVTHLPPTLRSVVEAVWIVLDSRGTFSF
jgi:uncharacterized membrane protein